MRAQVLFADPGGRARQKIVLKNSLPTGFCSTVLLQSLNGVNVSIPGYGAYTGHVNALLAADKDQMRNHWLPGLALGVADILRADGTAHPLCSRTLLKTVVSSLSANMLAPLVGLEIEMYLIPESLAGDILSHRFSPTSLPRRQYGSLNNVCLEDIVVAAEGCEIRIESMHQEFENFQYEFVLTPSDPVRSADDVLIFRELAKSVASRHGLFACFMPKPFANEFGSGMHINISLHRTTRPPSQETINDFSPGYLRRLAAHFPACCAIWNPTVNSYRRLNGADFSSVTSSVAEERRDSLLRVVNSGVIGKRLEFRLPDAACNPYSSIALCLALLSGDSPQDSSIEIENATLPTSLPEAILAFKQDPVVYEAFPLDFRAVLLAQEAEELRCYDSSVSDIDYMLHMPEFFL